MSYALVVTNTGLAKLQNANIEGVTLQLTQFAVGDGILTPTPETTALASEQYRADINRVEIVGGVITFYLVLPADVGGWYVREAALVDADGDLFAVANTPPSYKALQTEGAQKTLQLKLSLAIENTDLISFVVDETVVYGTQAWVQDQIAVEAAARVAADNAKAPLDSPALTGEPTAPTPDPGSNNTRIANTAFVTAAINALINAAPGALDTLAELSAALGDDPDFAATVAAAIAGKQDRIADGGLQLEALDIVGATPFDSDIIDADTMILSRAAGMGKVSASQLWRYINAKTMFPALIVSDIGSTRLGLYDMSYATPMKRDVAFGVPGTGWWACVSPQSGTYIAVAHSVSPFVSIYRREGSFFVKAPNPDILPSSSANCVVFSADESFLAVMHMSSPFITLYKRSGDGFVKLANPDILPTNTGYGAAWSPDGNYLAVATKGYPALIVYKRDGDSFTKLPNPVGLPPLYNGWKVAWSPDGTHLAIAYADSPFVCVFSRVGDSFTKLADPAVLPAGPSKDVAFSPSGTRLAVAHATAPYVSIYSRSGDTYTKLADPGELPTGDAFGVAFSADGERMAVTHAAAPFLTVYKVSGSTYTKISNPDDLPQNTANGVAFYPPAVPGSK